MKNTNITIPKREPLEPDLSIAADFEMAPLESAEPPIEADWLEEARLSFYGITRLSFRVSSQKAG